MLKGRVNLLRATVSDAVASGTLAYNSQGRRCIIYWSEGHDPLGPERSETSVTWRQGRAPWDTEIRAVLSRVPSSKGRGDSHRSLVTGQ